MTGEDTALMRSQFNYNRTYAKSAKNLNLSNRQERQERQES
ncbi:hypothetical protein [Nostoc commune]|nr:hypothetical protein [Nostoc commune]